MQIYTDPNLPTEPSLQQQNAGLASLRKYPVSTVARVLRELYCCGWLLSQSSVGPASLKVKSIEMVRSISTYNCDIFYT